MKTASSSTEAIQQAIAQGAITEAYQADPQQVIAALNQLRATEVTSYLQYKQHAYMAVSLFAPGLKNDFEAHALLELQHADLLAQRIQQSLNFSRFVAHKIRRKRGLFPRRFRAHRLQRGALHHGLLVYIHPTVPFLQTARN